MTEIPEKRNRVNCRYMISSMNIRQQFMSKLFIKFSFIHLNQISCW